MRGLSALRTRLLSLLGFSLYMAERENVNCIGEKIRLRAERQKNGLFEKVYFFKQKKSWQKNLSQPLNFQKKGPICEM